MKTITIGDIHGYDTWKQAGDIDLLIKGEFEPDYDKYIFVGDYVDSFDLTNIQIYANLLELIQFKKKFPEHVVLILGNHDLQYLYGKNFMSSLCSSARVTGL